MIGLLLQLKLMGEKEALIPHLNYIPPSPTGYAAYVAVLPDGRAVIVSSCTGQGLYANIRPESIEDLRGPGVTIEEIEYLNRQTNATESADPRT